MEEAKLKRIDLLFKAYAFVAGLASLLVLGIIWTNYLEAEIKSYCIHVPADQPHYFQISKSNACLIDWWAIIKEPILMSFLFMLALMLPYLSLSKLKRRTAEDKSS